MIQREADSLVTHEQLGDILAQYVTREQLHIELFFQPEEYLERINRVATFIKDKLPRGFVPKVALTLGSGGLGDIVNNIIPVIDRINYEDIPDFLTTTVEGHEGELVIGTLSGIPVMDLVVENMYMKTDPNPILSLI